VTSSCTSNLLLLFIFSHPGTILCIISFLFNITSLFIFLIFICTFLILFVTQKSYIQAMKILQQDIDYADVAFRPMDKQELVSLSRSPLSSLAPLSPTPLSPSPTPFSPSPTPLSLSHSHSPSPLY
jgi:hypothetical protein